MSDLKDFVIENGVLKKYIGNDADVVIPEGMTCIGVGAFSPDWTTRKESSIKNIVIPNSVTKIEAYAFSCCNLLENIIIPNSVTEISEGTFSNCGALVSIIIPNSVTYIGRQAFDWCFSLSNINIPDTVKKIDDNAFANCQSLENIIIPNSVTEIGEGAFSLCTSLIHITLPNRLTEIKWNTFGNCKSLTTLIIPNSVTKIESDAFANCEKLESIIIPDSVIEMKFAFIGCCSLKNIILPNHFTSLYYDTVPRVERFGIPEECIVNMFLSGETLSPAFENTFFEKSKKFINVAIKYGSISRLKQLMPPAEKIKEKDLKTYIENAEKFSQPEILIYLLDLKNKLFGFESEKEEKELSPLESAREIFKIKTKNGKATICGLKIDAVDIVIPEKIGNIIVTTIGEKAFAKTNIETIILPKSITEVGSCAFAKCKNLQNITLKKSVKNWEGDAFDGCIKLAKNDLIFIDGNVFKCVNPNINSVVIPDGTKSIKRGAFSKCKKIKELFIPEGVTHIEQYAFSECTSLEKVYLPKSLSVIKYMAFGGCNKLKEIHINSNIRKLDYTFDKSEELTIYAPAGYYAEEYAKKNNIPFVAE